MLVRRFNQSYDVAWKTTLCEIMLLIKFDEMTKPAPTAPAKDGKAPTKTATIAGLDRQWLATLKEKAHVRSR